MAKRKFLKSGVYPMECRFAAISPKAKLFHGVKKIMAVSFIVNTALMLAFLVLSFAEEINVKEKIKQENSGSADDRVGGPPAVSEVSPETGGPIRGESSLASPDTSRSGTEAVPGRRQAAEKIPDAVSGASAEEAGYGELIKSLYSRDIATRRKARETLIKAGPGAVKALLSAIDDEQSGKIMTGILAAIGPKAVTELIKFLKDAELGDRAGSALFRVIGPDSVDAAPALIECMQNNPRANGYCGAALVRTAGPKAKKYIPQILQALRSSGKTARVYAAAALGEIGPGAKEAVRGLADALSDPEAAVRLSAAIALGKIGKKAKPAAPELEKAAAGDVSAEVRREAAEASKKINGGG